MLSTKMMAPRKMESFDVAEPVITGDEQALLLVGYTGICGGDMHPYLGESLSAEYGTVHGHEFGGTVLEIRSSRSDIKPGDKVVVNPAVPCGHCPQCEKGLGYVCEDCNVIGGEWPGSFCEKIVVPVRTLYKLPAKTSLLDAALIEPLAFGEHCTAGMDGQTVVILGQGPIGLSCAMVAHEKKCKVIAVDIVDSQLEVSKQIGSDYVINSKKEDPVARVKSIVGEEGLNCVIDTVANNWSVDFCLKVLNKGGTMTLVGIPCCEIKPDLFKMVCREVSIRTRYLYTDEDFARAVDYVVSGKIDVRPMVSKVYPLAEIQEAFEYKATTPCLKVVLHNAGE